MSPLPDVQPEPSRNGAGGMPRPGAGPPSAARDQTARPLLVTRDPDLLDDLLRLAATAGAEVDVAADGAGAGRYWSGAGCVLVGTDAAESCLRARLPRRPGVVLLGGLDDGGLWQSAVGLGADLVQFLPEDELDLVARLADVAEGAARAAPVLAVVGGRGGAGATTLACALAVTAVRSGRRALLVDADPLGGGIDLVFGGEADRGLRWRDFRGTSGRVPAGALAEALPRMAGLAVLSGDREPAAAVPAEAMDAVLSAGRRAHDLVVVDLPRSVDEAARVVLEAADLVLLVLPAEVRAAAAARQVAAGLTRHCRDVRLVVRGPAPARVDGAQLARLLALPLAGALRPEPGLEVALEKGEPPARRGRGPLAELCARLLLELPAPGLRAA